MVYSSAVLRAAGTALLLLVCLVRAAAAQSHYYTLSRGSGGSSRRGGLLEGGSVAGMGLLDTLQRGHEGLLVQLDTLSKAIKEDELKLNNVFYKLGRHDTDIETTSSVQTTLRNTARKLESKLNKQAFNVDFLRRHVSELKRGVASSASTAASVTALQGTVAALQQSLAQALYRTEQLENKTRALEQDRQHTAHALHHGSGGSIDDNNIYYASRTPKTTYYYLDSDALEGVCDESSGWVSTPGGGCWLVSGGEELASFPSAVARCTERGGVLAQLPADHDQWPQLLRDSGAEHNTKSYWTSGTSAFSPGAWLYLFSGDAIPPEHWTNGTPGTTAAGDRHCAAMTPSGLVASSCAALYSYVCEKL